MEAVSIECVDFLPCCGLPRWRAGTLELFGDCLAKEYTLENAHSCMYTGSGVISGLNKPISQGIFDDLEK